MGERGERGLRRRSSSLLYVRRYRRLLRLKNLTLPLLSQHSFRVLCIPRNERAWCTRCIKRFKRWMTRCHIYFPLNLKKKTKKVATGRHLHLPPRWSSPALPPPPLTRRRGLRRELGHQCIPLLLVPPVHRGSARRLRAATLTPPAWRHVDDARSSFASSEESWAACL